MNKPVLHIWRGIPGSGKTEQALTWLSADPARRVRVNRAAMRDMLMEHWWHPEAEVRVVEARDAAIAALLHRGLDVACDDTNLKRREVRDLVGLAHRCGATVEMHDLTSVEVEVCVTRDMQRDKRAGESRIRRLHRAHAQGKDPLLEPPPPAHPTEPGPRWYEPVPGTPAAAIADIDGTLAERGDRSPYDYSRVSLDRPRTGVIAVVQALAAAGNRVLFVSGRKECCRADTRAWLEEHVGVAPELLLMRGDDDNGRDDALKARLFDAHIRDAYTVTAVVDDRQRVVRMWRSMGLTVLQAADGRF